MIEVPEGMTPFLISFYIIKINESPPTIDPGPGVDTLWCFSRSTLEFGLALSIRPILPINDTFAVSWPLQSFFIRRTG